MKYKVAQIIPYFGRWPEWIELYFYSCGRNPIVDFIFYTDCPLPKHRYDNTIFHQCSFEEYKQLVSGRLDVDYTPQNPYKLTDLKPFLGKVHEPELKDYDFWGFGDLDLVYGNLSMIVNDKFLERYDVITTHSYRMAGHFTLCKNNRHYREICFKIEGWEQGLSDMVQYSYDELQWSGLLNPFERNIGRLYRYIAKPLGTDRGSFFDILNSVFRPNMFIRECYTTPNPQPIGGFVPKWTYSKGEVRRYDGLSLPYLHFMCFKKNIWMDTDIYWRDGYYKLNDDVEEYQEIIFDYLSVEGIR